MKAVISPLMQRYKVAANRNGLQLFTTSGTSFGHAPVLPFGGQKINHSALTASDRSKLTEQHFALTVFHQTHSD